MQTSQRASKSHKNVETQKKEVLRRVQLSSQHHSEYSIGGDSFSNSGSQSEIITASSPGVVSPKQSMMTESYVCKKGWQDSNGVPWSKFPPKDECAMLKERIVNRNCARTTYGRSSPEDDDMGCFLAMDDVELLERGILDKSGNRRAKRVNATEFIPDGKGGMKKIDVNCLPKISADNLDATNQVSQKVVKPCCKKSEVTINPIDCISEDQFHRRIRSVSPISSNHRSGNGLILGTIKCDVGLDDECAVLEYAVCQDSRTYNLREDGKQIISLEFGALRSALIYVEDNTLERDNAAKK